MKRLETLEAGLLSFLHLVKKWRNLKTPFLKGVFR